MGYVGLSGWGGIHALEPLSSSAGPCSSGCWGIPGTTVDGFTEGGGTALWIWARAIRQAQPSARRSRRAQSIHSSSPDSRSASTASHPEATAFGGSGSTTNGDFQIDVDPGVEWLVGGRWGFDLYIPLQFQVPLSGGSVGITVGVGYGLVAYL